MYSTPTHRKVAVVGGGISGLAAAHHLRTLDPAVEMTLLEADDRLGGVIETVQIDGFLVERGPDNFITNVPHAVELCHQAGLQDDLLETSPRHRRALVVCKGKLQPIPEGFLLMAPRRLAPILTTPVLSIAGKLRLLLEFFISARQSPEEESLAEFATRRLGREVYRRLVEPLAAGIYTADGEQLSVAAALPQFVEMERQHGGLIRAAWAESRRDKKKAENNAAKQSGARYSLFMAPRRGMSQLVQAVAGQFPPGTVRLNSPVSGVAKSRRGGWSVRLGDDSMLHVDGVVLAVPPYVVAEMVQDVDALLAEALRQIHYAGSVVVNLGFRRDQISHPLDAFGFVVPAIESRRIIAAGFSSVKYAERAPEDRVLIRVFAGGALNPRMVEAGEDELRNVALSELGDLLGARGEPIFCDVARWRKAMPQYHVGHLERVAKIERQLAFHGGLAMAGNALRGVGIPQCILAGQRAAERVLSSL